MRVTQSIDLVQPGAPRRNAIVGWGIVVGLTFLEMLAVLFGKPSVLKAYPLIASFVAAVGEWIPLVQSFGRCAARVDAGSGLMLALNVVFFPIKLAALYFAHPKKIANPDRGWRGIFGVLYVFLIALVALVPTYIYGWIFAPGDSGLGAINKKTSALCHGGLSGFFSGMIQSGFSLLCAYVSLVIFIGILRSVNRVTR